MLDTPNYPAISRVMRVQPCADEKPASGFSWGDYEDVGVDHERTSSGGAAGNNENDDDRDGDGEGDDNDGWGAEGVLVRLQPTTYFFKRSVS